MGRTRSLPTLEKKPAPPRLADPRTVTSKLDDEHFSYFVPKSLQKSGKEKLLSSSGKLSKLKKQGPISFPFAGEGTGFRCSAHGCDWWPCDSDQYTADMPTAYRTHFMRPGFFRSSPVPQ